jgi:3-methyladenine DNA glycosylase/8-oxoguanine DNA glycosylase
VPLITRLTLAPQPPFDFAATAFSHGWAMLAPTSWDKEDQALGRVEPLASGRVVALRVTGAGDATAPLIHVDVTHDTPLSADDEDEIRRKVAHMFRLDEDFASFYALCEARGGPWAAAGTGFGRLLRSPTLFEDVVKTIATTNTQWGGTKRMIAALVDALGEPLPADPARRAFPSPEAMAAAPPETFTETARFGYRGPYVAELARRVAEGDLELEGLLRADLPTPELKKQLLAIKGVGPYAAATLLMLIGRYDEIAYDTVFRDFVSGRYFGGERPPPREMMAVYDDWGRWRYLAYWLELWLDDPDA